MIAFAGPNRCFCAYAPDCENAGVVVLLLIGVTLIAEGFGRHIPKGYIYFAVAFSVLVEVLNLRLRKQKTEPVHLHNPYDGEVSGKVVAR